MKEDWTDGANDWFYTYRVQRPQEVQGLKALLESADKLLYEAYNIILNQRAAMYGAYIRMKPFVEED